MKHSESKFRTDSIKLGLLSKMRNHLYHNGKIYDNDFNLQKEIEEFGHDYNKNMVVKLINLKSLLKWLTDKLICLQLVNSHVTIVHLYNFFLSLSVKVK